VRNPRVVLGGGLLLLIVLAAFVGGWSSPYGFGQTGPLAFAPPGAAHWGGTDLLGRDVLTRTLHGARISLAVGCIGAMVSLIIGVTYGAVAGYAGGRVDLVMMRIVDVLYSVPRLIFAMVIITVLDAWVRKWMGPTADRATLATAKLVLLFTGLGCLQWLAMARIVRGQVLSLKERDFVTAPRALGQGHRLILFRHILPNLVGIIIVYLTLTIPEVILQESILSFLGLGVQEPMASWGSLISEGATVINPVESYWWLLAAPASAMAVTLLALNFLGDGLRDVLDPRARGR
jgi:peptide/nickel transport system permease protein/oligopeptide transport system permease protein